MEALKSTPAEPAILRAPFADRMAYAVVLAVVVGFAPLMCLHVAFVSDADIWWHLRTAQWILAHHAVPRTDPFTSFGAGRPWAEYSWLFDLLAFKCFARFGLAGIVAFSTGMALAIGAALYHLFHRLQPDMTLAALLTVICGEALTRLYTPRSWLFSILFFALQLDILMHARRTGKTRELLWLPVLYALWANTHIEFFDGLVVLGIALGESFLRRWWGAARTRLSFGWIGAVSAACILATLANPYGWHIYEIGVDLALHPGLNNVAEMQALGFRTLPDFLTLFAALAAASVLAALNAQSGVRRFPLFETVLLVFAAVVSFRAGRDMWVMVIAAGAILAQATAGSEEQKNQRSLTAFTAPVFAAVLALLLFAGARVMRVDNVQLSAQLDDHLPVRAVDAIQRMGYAGPLYNNYDWGGYLIWALRMPVSVDERTAFNGDARLDRAFATWAGRPGWASDTDLQSAGLVIGPVAAPLTQLLRMDARFQLAYEDKLAAVFTARRLNEVPAIDPAPKP